MENPAAQSTGIQAPVGSEDDGAADRSNATAFAYTELKRLIHANKLTPGRTFLQQALAELLKVSRTPVREAVIRLAEEKLVEIRPRYGVYVRPFSHVELTEAYDLLAALESHAALRVAEKGPSEAFLKRLDALHETMEAAAAANDVPGWVAADESFHKEIVAAAGNALLRATVDATWERLSRARLLTLDMRSISQASNREHAAVLAALKKRDGRKAYEAFLKHRERAAQDFIETLKRRGVAAL